MNKPKTLAILIVEDSESDAQFIVRLLKKADYELVFEQVETAEQMRSALEKRTWDIVISDYKLPQFDGRAALNLLQEMGRDIPFIVVSGTIGEEIAVAMMKAGAHDYLIKGDLGRLVPAVERELNQAGIRRERRQAEDALRESEERYRSLFDRMLDGMYRSTHAGKFVDVNPAMVKMFGYSSKEEMLEIDIKKELYFDPTERGSHILDTGQQEIEVYRMRRKDGTEIWVEDRGYYVHDEQGRIIFHEGMLRDVTEQVQARDALAASEAELRALFASMQDVVLVIDREGVYRKIAPTNPGLLVKPSEELLGRNLRDVFPPEQVETIIGTVQQVLDTKQTSQIEYELLIGDRTVWFETSISPMDKDSTLWVARDVSERKQAEMATHQRLVEQNIIHQVSQSLLTTRLNPDAIYTSLHEAVARLMPCEAFSIVLDDPHSGDYHAVYLYDVDQRYPARRIPRGQGLSGRVISTGETLFIHDLLQSQIAAVHFGSPESTRSILAVPLRKDNDIVGMVAVQSYQPNMYGESQRVLLETLAAQVTAIIENARLYEKIQNELTERKRAEEALRASEERYRELFNSMIDGFALHEIVCDENGKPVDYRFLEVNPAYERLTGFQSANLIGKTVLEVMPNTEPYWIEIYGNVALTGRSTFFENYSGELGRHFEVSAYCPRPGQFAVIMVDITERKQAEQDIHQRVTELEVLYESGLALSQLLDPKEIGGKIIELLEKKLDWHHTTIRLYHPNDESLELLAFNQPGLEGEAEVRAVEERFNRLISKSGEGLSGWAVQNSQTVRSGDVSNDPRYIETFPGLRSGLYVPMKLGERMIGVISIESEQPNAFSEADERLVTTLANQSASAFENARLFEETHQRVTELEMLYQSGLALSQLLNPKEIGQKILELLKEKLGWQHTRIRLYHPQDDSLELLDFNQPGLMDEMERHEMVKRFHTLITHSDQGISGWVIKHGQSVRSGDVINDPRYIEAYPGICSGLYVPMKLGERMIGVISVESEQPDAFSEADERLLTTLVNQAASAFENARLFEVTRQHVMEVETLNRVSLVLRTISTQDEMLATVLDEALAVMNTSHGSIELWDDADDILLKKAVRGWSAQLIESPQKSDEGISGRVITSGEIYISREFASDPMVGVGSRSQVPPGWGGACLPIRTAQQTLGVLVVSVPSEREFNRDEIRLLSTLAEMTGAALHRMQLFNETARRAVEFASLYETSKTLSAENELTSLLQTIVEHAKTLLHTASSGVYLYDKEHEELEVVVDSDATPYAVTGTRLRLGEGAAGYVAQTRQPLRIEDYSTWEGRSRKYIGIPFHAVLEVPMLYGGELIGVLTADEIGDSKRKFTEADERLLSLFASQAAGAIHSARLHEETVHRLEHLQAMRAVDQAIASSLDMRLTLNIILSHTLPQLGVDAADVLLLGAGSNLLEIIASRGFRTRLLENVTVSESFAGRAIMEHRTITVSDIETAGQHSQFGKLWKEEGFSAYWCVPLIVKGEARGVLEIYRRTAFTPDLEWIEFLETLAGQAAIAIENTLLFENLQRVNTDLILAYNATIEGWSRALDLRDKETEGHTQRVADLTVAIAKAMGVKDQGILHIRRGALLHDIGKMGIPDDILLKPGKLTDEEWGIMRTHPQLARDLLMPIAYLREALDIPYSHHEKWDGTGYPQGLKGQQIPLTARFFAVVDVWDALTSDRPYRKKWTKKKAFTYIHEQRGRHFDPQVVDVFAKIVKVK